MNWITSDLHFNHCNILKFCKATRPFQTVEEMNNHLINEWNAKVSEMDTIYHLGDFIFQRQNKVKSEAIDILSQLEGKKVFILGNHDIKNKGVLEQFGEVYNYLELKYNKHFIVMCHYPLACWNKARYNSLHMFGHCHNTFKGIGKSLDVGYDAHGKILSLDEAIELADMKSKEILDGH